MTTRTLTRTATALAVACISLTALASASPTDPSRALLGQVDSQHTRAIVTRADPAGPSGADVMLNRSESFLGSEVVSQTETVGDLASRGLLGRT